MTKLWSVTESWASGPEGVRDHFDVRGMFLSVEEAAAHATALLMENAHRTLYEVRVYSTQLGPMPRSE